MWNWAYPAALKLNFRQWVCLWGCGKNSLCLLLSRPEWAISKNTSTWNVRPGYSLSLLVTSEWFYLRAALLLHKRTNICLKAVTGACDNSYIKASRDSYLAHSWAKVSFFSCPSVWLLIVNNTDASNWARAVRLETLNSLVKSKNSSILYTNKKKTLQKDVFRDCMTAVTQICFLLVYFFCNMTSLSHLQLHLNALKQCESLDTGKKNMHA